MAVVKVKIPDQGEARSEFIEELVNRIKYDVRGPFADALFDVKIRTEQSSSDDEDVMIVTSGQDDPKIADAARVAAVSWSGEMQKVAEAIYWETRS